MLGEGRGCHPPFQAMPPPPPQKELWAIAPTALQIQAQDLCLMSSRTCGTWSAMLRTSSTVFSEAWARGAGGGRAHPRRPGAGSPKM